MERPDIDERERIREGRGLGRTIYVIVGVIASAVLFWGAVTLVTGWHAWVVLGAILWTLVGMMVALNPKRPW